MQTETLPRPADVQAGDRAPSQRLLSLDVFRGGTMASMIMVNNQTSSAAYPQLLHARWHGWTFTDLVFPFFLWIVGVSITFSFARRVERGDSKGRLFLHILKRAAVIFAVGLALNGFPGYDFATIRIPGVLQRIAVCYLIAATIFLFTRLRGRVVWTAGLLALYWVLMMHVPVPGCGAGSLTPECNFARWVDGIALSGHMWSQTKVWDPEGIVSTLPAIATTLFGILCGMLLQTHLSMERKAVWMFAAGNALMLGGMLLGGRMPINKMLWTASYSLFTAGLAFVVLAGCYWAVDVLGWRRFAKPFAIYGMNALVIYVLSGLLARALGMIKVGESTLRAVYYRGLFEPYFTPANASLLYSLTHVAVLFGVAYFMYRRGWVVRA